MKKSQLLFALVAFLGGGPLIAQGHPQEAVAVGFVEKVGEGSAEALVDFMRAHFAADLWQRRSEEDWRRMAGMLTGRHAGLEIDSESVCEPVDVVEVADDVCGIDQRSIAVSMPT